MTAKDKLIFCILAIVSVAAVSIEYEIIETAEGSLSTAVSYTHLTLPTTSRV